MLVSLVRKGRWEDVRLGGKIERMVLRLVKR